MATLMFSDFITRSYKEGGAEPLGTCFEVVICFFWTGWTVFGTYKDCFTCSTWGLLFFGCSVGFFEASDSEPTAYFFFAFLRFFSSIVGKSFEALSLSAKSEARGIGSEGACRPLTNLLASCFSNIECDLRFDIKGLKLDYRSLRRRRLSAEFSKYSWTLACCLVLKESGTLPTVYWASSTWRPMALWCFVRKLLNFLLGLWLCYFW